MVVNRTNKIPTFQDFVDFTSENQSNSSLPNSGGQSGNNSVINKKNPIPTPPSQNQGQTSVQVLPYQQVFVENDWQEDTLNNNFKYLISGETHEKGPNIVYDVYELTANGFEKILLEDFIIDANANIALVSYERFNGKIVIK